MSCTFYGYGRRKFLTNHFQLTDTEFETCFENGTLPPTLFDHEAHLRLAWVYIKKYGEAKAIEKVCEDIKQYDLLHGKGDKFHVTVTVAAVKAVHHFYQKTKSGDFKGFIEKFPKLKTAFKALLDQHYGFNIFSNEKAKVQYLEPDLLPFH